MVRITTPITLQQSVFSQQALWLRNRRDAIFELLGLRPFNQGTPARKHAITDRAARKAKARAYANARAAPWISALPVAPHLHPRQRRVGFRPELTAPFASDEKTHRLAMSYSAGAEKFAKRAIAINYAEVEARVLAQVGLTPVTPDRWLVGETETGWWVQDTLLAEPGRGPYQAKKTANRVARTLNGG